jgi:uncharacterized phiE125 gp8 family phage protein
MIRVITPPAAFPVTREEAKTWCRIDSTDTSQDAVLDMLIAAMVDHAEHLTGRAFVERTMELSGEYFQHCVELPLPPLLGIDSVAYTDKNGDPQTVDAANYEADTVSEPGKLRPVSGASWPAIGAGFNPVRIRYRAGYAAPLAGSPPAQDLTDNSYLPAQLRTWLAARICTLYDNRDQLIVGVSVQAIPRDFADGLLDSLTLGTRLF